MNLIVILVILITVNSSICPNKTRIVKDRDFQPIQLKYPYTNVFFQKDSNYYYVAGNHNGHLEQTLIEKFERKGDIWTRFYPDGFIFNEVFTTKDYVFAIGCTKVIQGAFLIIVNATSSAVLRHYFVEKYCYSSIVANNNYYFIAGTKYIGNETYAFVSKHEIKNEKRIYEQIYGDDNNGTISNKCENKGVNLVLISDDEIIVTMVLRKYYNDDNYICWTYILNVKGDGKIVQWEIKLYPFSNSAPTAISTYNDIVSVAGRFMFNLQLENTRQRVVACGLGLDSFLVTINITNGAILYFGSFCDISEISSLHINDCSFVISGKHKKIQNKVYLATHNHNSVNRERHMYHVNETLVDSTVNSQMHVEGDYITTIVKNDLVHLERYVMMNN